MTFERRKTLENLLLDLTRSFHPNDVPADHVCRPTRYQVCSHGRGGAPLLDRLALLVPASQSTAPENPDAPGRGSGARKSVGSPAPWSAPAAELLDEVMRGAAELERQARCALGLPEFQEEEIATVRLGRRVVEAPTPVYDSGGGRGRRALARLPGLAMQLREVGHPLGVIELADGRLRPGRIEQAVSRWHTRAMELTGFEVPWQRMPPGLNPDRAQDAERWIRTQAGPVCASPACSHDVCGLARVVEAQGRPRLGPVCASCAHRSCGRIRRRRQRYLAWSCPTCFADSLRVNPLTGTVRCLRESCSDQDWTMEELEENASDPWGDFDG
ncbi:hypothetical protein G9U51_08365 [Calidifontibacter sp. DB0510]|uniref:Uncharacterized protein n=1 Tax=Metallococcus carri TaxID=1656884 RepID=A0A967EAE2_9MICO|nr:hypothetical protein [Metallococcus carri]NHN55789.1 hypothetical protein [Metallococcus carri]NOP38522.1 hypothetical protein [Calidifontibacter sp. DB2511S]